jgi:hypothetical protein
MMRISRTTQFGDVSSFVSFAAWSHARVWAVGGRIVVVVHASHQFESNKKYPEMPLTSTHDCRQVTSTVGLLLHCRPRLPTDVAAVDAHGAVVWAGAAFKSPDAS